MNKSQKMKDPTIDTTDHLAENLLTLLNAHKINESELAKNLNIPYNTVHRLLTGETLDPRVSTLQQIGDYFEVGLDFLLNKQSSISQPNEKRSLTIPVLDWNLINNPNFIIKKDSYKKTIQIANLDNVKDINALFALESTKSMQPRFPLGTVFIINTQEQAIDGDLVLIRFKENNNISLRELIIDSPFWHLNPIIPGSTVLIFQHEQHEIIGVIILTMIQTRSFK